MCSVRTYVHMYVCTSTVVYLLLGEPESLCLLNMPTTTAVYSCVLMSLSVTHCVCFTFCMTQSICDSCLLLCVCHLVSLDEILKETA